MSIGFTTFVVPNPHDIPMVAWNKLPPSAKSRVKEQEVWSRTYEAADWRRYKADADSYRSTFSIGHSRTLRLSRIADRRGTRFDIREPGLDAFCVSVMVRGSSRTTLAGTRKALITEQTQVQIFPGRPATYLLTSDDSVRLQLWVPGGLLRRALEAHLEQPVNETLEFSAQHWEQGGGRSVSRLVRYLHAEMVAPGSLLLHGVGATEFESLFVQSLLHGLPHNYSERLTRLAAMGAPGNVRRAEEYLRASAEGAVTIENVAQAAGCSVRALQLAFRRHRGITPMEALRRVRLERARAETLCADGSRSVIDIAMKFGFSHPGRFATYYRNAFGEFPSEVLRQRARRS